MKNAATDINIKRVRDERKATSFNRSNGEKQCRSICFKGPKPRLHLYLLGIDATGTLYQWIGVKK